MTATPTGVDVRGFYQALGIELPGWAHTEAPVRCFADPDSHQHQDRDASCSVNLASGAFNCHGCGAHGGAYDAALAKGCSPREAIDLMVAHGLTQRRPASHVSRQPSAAPARDTSLAAASRAGVRDRATRRVTRARLAANQQAVFAVDGEEIDAWAEALARDREMLDRLRAERGWDERVLRELQVGFDGERITIPIPDERGAPEGLLRLRIDAAQRPKVLAVPGTRLALIPRPAPEQTRVWLVEGPSDMLAARSAGLPALAVPGTHAWRTEWAPALAGCRVTVVMDADRPGRQAARRIADDLERHDAAHVRILELAPSRDDGYDVSDWLRDGNHLRTPRARTYTSEELRRLLDAERTSAPSAGRSAVRGSATSSVAAAAAYGGGGRGYGCARF
jgi:DNA primase